MKKAMTILYVIEDGLYVNLTNKCPCNCIFCLRQDGDGAHGSESLWLEHDPSIEEILAEFEEYNLEDYKQVVLCGYGEPLTRIDEALEVCKYVRSKSNIKIRVNTNGLADLIHKKSVACMLEGLVDSVSISLNAPTAEAYLEIAKPRFGLESFEALLKFAEEVNKYVPEVTFTVVDQIITPDQIEASRQIAEHMGINFRVRPLL